MRLKLLERFLKVRIYTCHNNKCSLNQEDFLSLNQEMRSLALQEFGEVPEYQCFLKNYDSIKDKIIVTHRNSEGELDGFSSSIIVKTEINGINEFMHLGIFIVSSSARHKNIQFKLGLGSTAGYLFSSPLKKRY